MPELNNEVLAEQIKQLRKEFSEHRQTYREEMKELERDVDRANKIAGEVHMASQYMKESVQDMKTMMANFINVVSEQNKKIDDFVNSDKRDTSKKQFVISVVQVVSGVAIALIGYWASGKI